MESSTPGIAPGSFLLSQCRLYHMTVSPPCLAPAMCQVDHLVFPALQDGEYRAHRDCMGALPGQPWQVSVL